MAREYARIKLSIADDDDFERLSIAAQWLYLRVLLPDQSLNQCGALDWRPGRLTGKAADLDLDLLLGAAGELEAARYVLFDPVTEEALIRSYMRNDEILRNPKMAATVPKSFRLIASKVLRAAVVTELARIKADRPEFTSWEHRDTSEELAKLLARPGLDAVGYTDAYSMGISYRVSVANGYPVSVANSYRDPVPITNSQPEATGADNLSDSVPIPSHLAPITSHLAPGGGLVSPEGHQSDGEAADPPPPTSADPPSRFCEAHPTGTAAACRACEVSRTRREAFDARAVEVERERVRSERADAEIARAVEIANCELGCAERDGYTTSGRVCDHREHSTPDGRAAALATIRASLDKEADA